MRSRRRSRRAKHIYCEKPIAGTLDDAWELYQLAKQAGVKHGVVQDKLWLPGLLKLKSLIDKGFFGRIFAVRGEFGYWVFEGDTIPAQRPSWNYRREDGGGILVDMLCHWRYVLDNLFGSGPVVMCLGATHIPQRVDENGQTYACTAEDSAYTTFELEGGIVAHFNSSWCTRVRRDDLLTLQVEGTLGSAVAGLRDCWMQPYGGTPRPVWNPDIPQKINFFDNWQKMPDQLEFDNAFKAQWELFLRKIRQADRRGPLRPAALGHARGRRQGGRGTGPGRLPLLHRTGHPGRWRSHASETVAERHHPALTGRA
jgi:predicted dehydrogenase